MLCLVVIISMNLTVTCLEHLKARKVTYYRRSEKERAVLVYSSVEKSTCLSFSLLHHISTKIAMKKTFGAKKAEH